MNRLYLLLFTFLLVGITFTFLPSHIFAANITEVNVSIVEKFARFLTNPFVIPILLTIASLGLVFELFTPGFGISGFIGLTALILFFFGHLVTGLAGIEALILFIIGVLLIIAEFFLPGAIAGILGLASIIASLFVASGDVVQMGYSLLIALVITIIALVIMIQVLGKRVQLFNKIVLNDAASTEKGYISNENRLDLIGKEGISLTTLRPSGTAVFIDERVDVVTEGGYIEKGLKIVVFKVEGSRIVVREIKNEEG